MDVSKVKSLLQRYREGRCTDVERDLVENWYQKLLNKGEEQWTEEEKRLIKKNIEQHIIEKTGKRERGARVFQLSRIVWWAAAGIFLALSAWTYLTFFQTSGLPATITENLSSDVSAPQASKAMITLADGSTLVLDSMVNEALVLQGNMQLLKMPGGEIAYKKTNGEKSTQLAYNTLSNPKGSKVINMVLADGSKVWLNAGSVITYPIAFVENERSVSITGEAYFEVAHDASKPFMVYKDEVSVKVLGTRFNVNAFEDDGEDIEITLLEGAVKVKNGNVSSQLKPGEQARVGRQLKIMQQVNVDAVMAWKNGYFHFEDASLENVMERISRWYDVNVVYKGEIPHRSFMGEMQRDLSLAEVLKILEKNKVHFEIVGKELIVSP